MEKDIKVTFIGDIMCEKSLRRAFDLYGPSVLDGVFDNTKSLFAGSDYVIGNLETVFGGPSCDFRKELYRFSAPDEFAAAVRAGGIGLVTCATNHSLDAGTEGLRRTADILDCAGLSRTGIQTSPDENRVFIKTLGGVRLAVVNYTYGTNTHETGVILREDESYLLNLLKPQTYNLQTYEGKRAGSFRRAVSGKLAGVLSQEERIRLKKALGMEYNCVRTDHLDPSELDERYTERFIADMNYARRNADVVAVCLHCGGQFNTEPGEFSRYAAGLAAANGADAVIGCHAHTVQRGGFADGVFTAFCLGNYSISPSSVYLLPGAYPEYSVAVHLTLSSGGIREASYSVLKIIEDGRGVPSAVPADVLYARSAPREKEKLLRDICVIRSRFTGDAIGETDIRSEYPAGGLRL